MSDIKIQIKNYKLIKDYEQEHKNARILLVTGKNEIGKTSLIRAIIQNITAKSTTPDPVSHGEETGSNTITIPDKDGGVVTIVHDFSNSNKNGTFYAIDNEGRKIKEVKRIREIVGIFEELSVDAFYTLVQNAPGRKRIITDYFYKLLTATERIRIFDIDEMTSKGGSLYDDRTAINQHISYLEGALQKSKPEKEEEVLAAEYDKISIEVERLEDERLHSKEAAAKANLVRGQITQIEDELDGIESEYISLKTDKDDFILQREDEIKQLEERIKRAQAEIEEKKVKYEKSRVAVRDKELALRERLQNFKNTDLDFPDYNEMEMLISEAKSFRDQAYAAKGKIEKAKEFRDEIIKARQKAEKFEKEIIDLRNEKVKILKDSNLPAGLMIDGDEFTWNGFAFSDSQISKSSALLVIAEILCNVIESKIVYLGEKALFDKDRFKQLIKIAEKHGKIPVLEQVIDDQTEIKVITEVEDV